MMVVGYEAGHHAGVGLTSIRERTAELGGTCQIEPRVGGGTRLHVRFPLTKVAEREEVIDAGDRRPYCG